jgi:hypothetical protein
MLYLRHKYAGAGPSRQPSGSGDLEPVPIGLPQPKPGGPSSANSPCLGLAVLGPPEETPPCWYGLLGPVLLARPADTLRINKSILNTWSKNVAFAQKSGHNAPVQAEMKTVCKCGTPGFSRLETGRRRPRRVRFDLCLASLSPFLQPPVINLCCGNHYENIPSRDYTCNGQCG